jgi:hypothetical protein
MERVLRRSTAVIDGSFVHDLAVALHNGRNESCAMAWSAVLAPAFGAGRQGLPDQSLVRYQRVAWSRPLEPGRYEFDVTPVWCSARTRSTDVAIEGRAWSGGQMVAETLIVVRTPEPAESWGRPSTPEPPTLPEPESVRTLVVTAGEIEQLAQLPAMAYGLNTNAGYAQQAGFPNAIVPAAVLIGRLGVVSGDFPAAGRVEAWFHQPVPIGSVMQIGAGGPAPDRLMTGTLIGRAAPAVTMTLAPTRVDALDALTPEASR